MPPPLPPLLSVTSLVETILTWVILPSASFVIDRDIPTIDPKPPVANPIWAVGLGFSVIAVT